MTEQYLIDHYQLEQHPEGGFYKETYRSKGIIKSECLPGEFKGERNFSTAIYFLLRKGDFSAFHRIKSDECWHFYEGDSLLVHIIDIAGNYSCIRLGRNVKEGETYQFIVPAGCWFASEPAPGTSYAFVGCTVAPGFDFADFEMASKAAIIKQYPQHQKLLERLCR